MTVDGIYSCFVHWAYILECRLSRVIRYDTHNPKYCANGPVSGWKATALGDGGAPYALDSSWANGYAPYRP